MDEMDIPFKKSAEYNQKVECISLRLPFWVANANAEGVLPD
jgi:hypothetical protein